MRAAIAASTACDTILEILAQDADHGARLLHRIVSEVPLGQPLAHELVVFERFAFVHEAPCLPVLGALRLGAEELLGGPVGEVLVGS